MSCHKADVVTVYTGGAASGAAWGWAAGLTGTSAAIAGGFVAGAIQTNSLRGGVYGAFSAGIFNKIGIAYQGATGMRAAQGVVAHAVAGGVMSSLQGGKFGHGFVSAGFTQALSPGIGKLEGPVRQGTAVAILGGTTSVMTGGKFGNGAVTAAFSYAFGSMASRTASAETCDCRASPSNPAGARWSMESPNLEWANKIAVVEEDGVTVFRGALTVSGPSASRIAADVNATWNGATATYEGVTYRSEISMSVVKSDGDWQAVRMSNREWTRLNSMVSGGQVAAFVPAFGSSQVRLAPIKNWTGRGTMAHEFGHSLGLSHAPPNSGSIMSYDAARSLVGRDLYNLSGGYR